MAEEIVLGGESIGVPGQRQEGDPCLRLSA